jgi:hypothetical protein
MPRPRGRITGSLVIKERRKDAASLYCRGLPQRQIAERLGVTQAQISVDLKAIRKEWLESSLRDFDSVKAEQLAKLDEVERSAWDSWERSSKVKVRMPDGSIEEQERPGDPRFLDRVFSCIETRLKVIGAIKSPSVKVQQTQAILSWDELVQASPQARDENGKDTYEREIDRALQHLALPAPPSPPVSEATLLAKVQALEEALAKRNGHHSNGAIGGQHHD